MANEFIQGFATGFGAVEQIRTRRAAQQLQNRRVSLAEAANVRAESQFNEQQNQRSILRDRQTQIDRSNELLATAQRDGIDSLTPEEATELEGSAGVNPNVGTFFQSQGDLARDVDAFSSLRGLADVATQSPGGEVTQGAQPAAPSTDPRQQVENVSAVLEPLPGEAVAGDPGAGPGGVQQVTRVDAQFILGADFDISKFAPETTQAQAGASQIIPVGMAEVPGDFPSRDEFNALPVDEQTALRNQLRTQMGESNAALDAARLSGAEDEITVDTYRAFNDPNDSGGEAMRQMTLDNPVAVITQLQRDLPRLLREDPNTAALTLDRMRPIVDKAVDITTEEMRQVPLLDSGVIDIQSREYGNAKRRLDATLDVAEKHYESYNASVIATIRGDSIPTGQSDISTQLATAINEAPNSGVPATNDEFTINNTVGRQAITDVQSGATRRITDKQVEAIAWLAHRNYITAQGVEDIFAGRAFTNPADFELQSHDVDKVMMRFNTATGRMEVVYTPPTAPEDFEELWGDNQQGMINDHFLGSLDDDASQGEQEQARSERAGFLRAMSENQGEIFGVTGGTFDTSRLNEMLPTQMNTLLLRYQNMLDVKSEHDNSWKRSVPFIGGKSFDDMFGEQAFMNFDQLADDMGMPSADLPITRAQVQQARAALLQSTDQADQISGVSDTDLEIANEVLRQTEAQRAAPIQRPVR